MRVHVFPKVDFSQIRNNSCIDLLSWLLLTVLVKSPPSAPASANAEDAAYSPFECARGGLARWCPGVSWKCGGILPEPVLFSRRVAPSTSGPTPSATSQAQTSAASSSLPKRVALMNPRICLGSASVVRLRTQTRTEWLGRERLQALVTTGDYLVWPYEIRAHYGLSRNKQFTPSRLGIARVRAVQCH